MQRNLPRRLAALLRRQYDNAAAKPAGLLAAVPVDRGAALLTAVGYTREETALLRPEQLAVAFPCHSPLPVIQTLRPDAVLDLGCGAGVDLFLLAASPAPPRRLTGLDFSRGLLAIAGRCRPEAVRIDLVCGDGTRPPFARGSFELISMNGSFNVIVDKQAFLRRAATLLVPGGHLLINDLLRLEPFPENFTDDPVNWTWNVAGALSAEEFNPLAAATGLTIERLEIHEPLPPVARAGILLSRSPAPPVSAGG
ncbi:MAG: class I SAM-dependent methyltransferase [Deltaproteobacteria bacterium]|nr:class I SAM-dependent methyltransferase [Candidatus Anaeroferrophillacea bacterium]